MFFSGIADEAAPSLSRQLKAHGELGWNHIELRLIDGKNVCDQTDDEWSRSRDLLQAESIEVVGFGGQIGNWARPITTDFQVDLDEIRRVAPRMRETGTKFLRIMSYPNDENSPRAVDAWKAEVFRRLKELTTIAEGEDIILAHENCNGYGATAGRTDGRPTTVRAKRSSRTTVRRPSARDGRPTARRRPVGR